MFSSHLPQKTAVPPQVIFASAGLLLVVVMLVSVAVVASGQVKKAQLRESLLASQRSAMVSCLETLGGKELNKCLIEARAVQDLGTSTNNSATALADNSGGAYSRPDPARSASPLAGFMAASFTTHR